MKLVIAGTGYVGLVTGVCLSEVGHEIYCVDIDQEKIQKLKSGIAPIYERDLTTYIHRNVANERLFFTTNIEGALAQAKAIFIAVGTPEGEDGSANLSYVEGVAKDIAKYATNDLLVIVKSTVPVGTCDRVQQIIESGMAKRHVNYKVTVASNPEFLKEGVAIDDFMKPDRIVVGLENGAGTELFREIYEPFIQDDPGRLLFMSRKSSELTKYTANAMLATRISFMNEIARLCERVGANADDVRRGVGSDPRIGKKFLYSGPGYGGSCFPKDVEALLKSAETHDIELSVLSAVKKANKTQKTWVATKIKKHFGDLRGKKFAVWGLAFKPGTDDTREAPAKTIISLLLEEGATVAAHDPKATKNFSQEMGQVANLSYVENAYDALKDADGLVLVTEWPEYKRPNWGKINTLLKQKVVFDFRNQYPWKEMKSLGYHYICVGRPDATYAER